MPTYSFQCSICGYKEDKRLPVNERDHPQECPDCGVSLTRLFSSTRINMNGYGAGSDEIDRWAFENLDDKAWSKSRQI